MEEADQEKPKPPLSRQLLLVGSAITVYNVFAHHQMLFDLSRSVHWLASYWRYLLGLPFEWLHVELSPLQREAIVLLLFCISAALAPIRRKKNLNFRQTVGFMFKPMSADDRNLIESVGGHEGSCSDYVIFVIFALGVSQLIIAVILPVDVLADKSKPLPEHALIFLLAIAVLYLMVPIYALIESRSNKLATIATRFIAAWFHFIVNFISLLASLYRPIVSTSKFLLLMLVLDIMFKYTLDPLLASYPTLPCPPNMERC